MRFAVIVLALIIFASFAQCSPFATEVVDYSPGPSQYQQIQDPVEKEYYLSLYMDPLKALGRPYGISPRVPSNASVVTLGDGGSITLAFDHDVMDDSKNPGGYDFIVFGNAIFVGGNPAYRWQEPAFAEISQDGVNWFLILPEPLPSELKPLNAYGNSSAVLRNYGDYTPTMPLPANRTAEEFYAVPDRQSAQGVAALLDIDTVSGGGDAFDIADAVLQVAPGVPVLDMDGRPVPAGIDSFRYIRLTSAVKQGEVDPELGEISAEIDAVADVAPAVSVGEAKRLENGAYAVIWGAKVTAIVEDEGFWIESPDRAAGMKVLSQAAVQIGDEVAITGYVHNKTISDTLITVLGHGESPAPVGLSGRSAQSSLADGLLVKVWGKKAAYGEDWVAIDDGSGFQITVSYGSLPITRIDKSIITAVGILTRDSSGAVTVTPRTADDVTSTGGHATQPDGYTVSDITFASWVRGFDILPNGWFVVMDGAYDPLSGLENTRIFVVTPTGTQVGDDIYTYPEPVFGSFVKVDAVRGLIYFGENWNGTIRSINFDGSGLRDVATVLNNYDAAIASDGRLLVTAANLSWTASDILLMTDLGPKVVVDSPSPYSGPIAFDSYGNLCYGTAGIANGDFIMAWSAEQLQQAYVSDPLTTLDGNTIVSDLFGLSGMDIDDSGIFFSSNSWVGPYKLMHWDWNYGGLSEFASADSWIGCVRINPDNGAISVASGMSICTFKPTVGGGQGE